MFMKRTDACKAKIASVHRDFFSRTRFFIMFFAFVSSLAAEASDQKALRPSKAKTDACLSHCGRGQIVSQDWMASITKEELDLKFGPYGFKAKNGVKVYKVVYKTVSPVDPEQLLDASGVIVFPDSTAYPQNPWMSLQHGTITGDKEAPSFHGTNGLLEGSQGFVTAVQDYIGFGSTKDLFHPYMVEETYTASGIDMLRATKSLALSRGLALGPLFLRGYSEGGYATMALQKYLELHHPKEFDLVASAPAAGPYDLVVTSQVLGAQDKANPVNLPFVVLSYDHWFAKGQPVWDIKKVLQRDPAEMFELFSGKYTNEELFKLLPHKTSLLFREDFVKDAVLEVPQTVEGVKLRGWLTEESLVPKGWAPRTPTRLYHCVDDTAVPVQATENALKYFKALNPAAPVEGVLLKSPDPSNPYDHINCPLYFSALPWFESFLSQAVEKRHRGP